MTEHSRNDGRNHPVLIRLYTTSDETYFLLLKLTKHKHPELEVSRNIYKLTKPNSEK